MNIVFLILDTHRRDRLGMYGYPKNTSPNLDQFAEKAVVFENAISPAQWTIPSHASMFSGEYPSTHLTTQSSQSLDPYFKTIAEYLHQNGYKNTAFCNNPLVGVLDNGLKRGFDTFYNYGGAVPTVPVREYNWIGSPVKRLAEYYTQFLRRISYPIQNAVARSDRLLGITLNPHLVPLWTKFANFKGDTARSIADAANHLNQFPTEERSPKYVFINLMETHLPFTPPEQFIKQHAPIFRDEPESNDFMQLYNTRALEWLLPVDPPFSDLERKTLSDMYDAEVAYQDFLLSELLESLDNPYHKENTLVIISADHGELLGEHNFMGHGFRVFQELVHVPLVIRFPGQQTGYRNQQFVSTMQLFHTIMDCSGITIEGLIDAELAESQKTRIEKLSLRNHQSLPLEDQKILTEAYPPENLLMTMQRTNPDLIDKFLCEATFRGIFNQEYRKAVTNDFAETEIFDLVDDGCEEKPLDIHGKETLMDEFESAEELILEETRQRQPEDWTRSGVRIEDDLVSQRLKNLGYLE